MKCEKCGQTIIIDDLVAICLECDVFQCPECLAIYYGEK